ncbi:hypothetical protein F0562_031411 [Nyssa sinensis]|uniref:Expansin-like EG45 domain-containing protein n=1 Tax=Nyssa sinensis TaxID=561372 RepID=A0A5J5AUE3_9ASTE|nr:hypothetical protein F0562_031411 [Nyssa sinensis]
MATRWSSAGATWYGAPNGAGSDVSQQPFSSMITAAGPSLYKSGKECGACYQVKCTTHRSCSGKPARVVITDSCPGGPCLAESAHFDLSGTAFGAMAIPGQEDMLRNAGVLQIRYARVACDYSGKNIVFSVDQGSNPNYFAVVVEFEEGDGDLAAVDLKEESSGSRGLVGNATIMGCCLEARCGKNITASIFYPIDIPVFRPDNCGKECDSSWVETWCNLSIFD